MSVSRSARPRCVAVVAGILMAALTAACGSDDDAPVEPTASKKTLSVTGGAGSGRVTSADGKIDCRLVNGATTGPTCSFAFDSGTVTTLTATADAGQEFVAWSGDCSGAACQVTVTRDVTASPRFVVAQGPLVIELTTPNNNDGAILFTVSGPSILGVTAATGVEVLESRATSNGTTMSTLIARGDLATGTLGQLTVRGIHLDGAYTAQVGQVAARASGNFAQRTDLSGYKVTIRR